MTAPQAPVRWLALVESNTTGSGRQLCAVARSRGLRPVILAADPGRYPYAGEDGVDVVACDTADSSAVVACCKRFADAPGLAGVMSSSEYYVALAARAAGELGLPGPDAQAVERCQAKDLQRQVLEAAGVATPAFASASTPAAARRAAEQIGTPVVVKPVAGSGSRGVRLCGDLAEVAAWAAGLLRTTANERGLPVPRRVLVEEFVEGPEFSVEVFDGAAVGAVAKHLGAPPHFVETGHDVPAPLPPQPVAGLCATAEEAVAALGLGWGAAHVELRLAPGGRPVTVEVNPRLAGGMIPELVALASGIDLLDRAVARGSGQAPKPCTVGLRHASIRFVLAPGTGTLEAVTGVDRARALAGVHRVEVTAAVGAPVAVTGSFLDRLGYAIAVGPDARQAAERAEVARSLVRVRLRLPGGRRQPSRE